MAYKQPYKQVKNNNDGASEPITAAILGALKLGKVIAGGIKAAKAAKVATTAVKAGKTLGTAAKTAKGAGKVAKGAGKLTKMATKGAKTIKTSSSMPKLQTLKKTTEVGKKTGKLKDLVTKGKGKIDKLKQGYDNVAGKIADKTGFDKDAIKEFGSNQAANAISTVQNKMQDNSDESISPAERGTPSGITPPQTSGGGYENPYGPNMFRSAVGPSMKPITITNADNNKITYRKSNDGASNNSGIQSAFTSDKDALTNEDTFGNKIVRNLSAPITIKGVTFDAGDALRLGIMGYKAGKKGISNIKNRPMDDNENKGRMFKNIGRKGPKPMKKIKK